jgi:hypothetical protein
MGLGGRGRAIGEVIKKQPKKTESSFHLELRVLRILIVRIENIPQRK